VTDGGAAAFGRRLAALREARGWSKTELAKRSGLDPSSVSRLEAGERTPESGTVDALAAALAISPVERERLIASAGLRSAALNDPLVTELIELLVDPSLPADLAADVRTLLRVAVEHGRRGRRE
jgi:transcriptional regulator with XRE-family HTH domain